MLIAEYLDTCMHDMAKHCTDNQHDSFFDANEEISSDSDDNEASEQNSDSNNNRIPEFRHDFPYDLWIGNPKSIDERRDEFTRKTGFVIERCQTARQGPDDTNTPSDSIETVYHIQKPVLNDANNLSVRNQCLTDDGTNSEVDKTELNRCAAIQEFRRTFDSNRFYQQFATGKCRQENVAQGIRDQPGKEGWLKRFSFKAASMLGKERLNDNKLQNFCRAFGSRSQKVRVRSHKKWSKELSSLYRKQDFCAHKGPILAMKFSPDGRYLATGGEDGTLSIWKVIEDDRSTDFDLLSFSPASTSLFFSVNGNSNLASFLKLKEEGSILNKLKKPSDSACIMIPRKGFRIVEKPLQEFHGHKGEILDVSWSKKGHLLSSSVDKTVRLWQVECGQCLRVFPHNDYVTCTEFNPIDDNYFISGSIDGIVRIWEIVSCQVIHWIDVKEIVTAICYRPDGKGGIVGSMAGSCSFFDITDDCMHPHPVIYLYNKRTFTCKRITGFQFSPSDPSEVVVSSADSQVRILNGANVIYKLRGSLPLIDKGRQIFASFTSDGKHIISATEESNVYMWNHLDSEKSTNNKQSRPKNIWSCESFLSQDALIAVPWHGMTATSEAPPLPERQYSPPRQNHFDNYSDQESPFPSGDFSSVDSGSPSVSSSSRFSDQPEEVLTSSSPAVVLPAVGKIDYEFLRNVCESILSGCHLWGLVIVTAGKDGKIRTYQNYGLPVKYPTGKSLRSSFSFSALKKRCTDNLNKSGSSSFSVRDSFRSF